MYAKVSTVNTIYRLVPLAFPGMAIRGMPTAQTALEHATSGSAATPKRRGMGLTTDARGVEPGVTLAFVNDSALANLPTMRMEATSQIIADQVRELIAKGEIPQGAPLSEVALAKALGVSRGPVREALQRLVQEGLLENERNRKLRVPRLTRSEVLDVYRTREAIEAAGLEAIIRDLNSDFIEQAEALLEEMEGFVSQEDAAGVTESDLSFHLLIIEHSRSPRLARAFATLLIETRMCMNELLTLDPIQGRSVELHRAILHAVVAKDLEAARQALREHNAVVLETFLGE